MKRLFVIIFYLLFKFILPSYAQTVSLPIHSKGNIKGVEINQLLNSYPQSERDSITIKLFLDGNFPSFLENLSEIKLNWLNEFGEQEEASYYVLSDYISLGTNKDFVRIPMTPNSVQKLADSLGFYLSNTKICDDVYKQALVKLEPIPMTSERTSYETYVHHNDLIEKQRMGQNGLIAGIKKDVISTSRLDSVEGMVAIYGWHRLDGRPIQSVYIKHADYYVDYSHGVRLVYPYLFWKGQKISFKDVLKNFRLKSLISHEEGMDYYRYKY